MSKRMTNWLIAVLLAVIVALSITLYIVSHRHSGDLDIDESLYQSEQEAKP